MRNPRKQKKKPRPGYLGGAKVPSDVPVGCEGLYRLCRALVNNAAQYAFRTLPLEYYAQGELAEDWKQEARRFILGNGHKDMFDVYGKFGHINVNRIRTRLRRRIEREEKRRK